MKSIRTEFKSNGGFKLEDTSIMVTGRGHSLNVPYPMRGTQIGAHKMAVVAFVNKFDFDIDGIDIMKSTPDSIRNGYQFNI